MSLTKCVACGKPALSWSAWDMCEECHVITCLSKAKLRGYRSSIVAYVRYRYRKEWDAERLATEAK